jgi:hypothetical protein
MIHHWDLLKNQRLVVGLLVPSKKLISVSEKLWSSCIVKYYIITQLVPEVECRVIFNHMRVINVVGLYCLWKNNQK